MAFPLGRCCLAAALALAVCGPARADDVIFENVRIFDGTSSTLSEPGTPLPELVFGGRPVEPMGDLGWIIHMSDGEHLHLYLSSRHEFLFYFHSW